MKFLVITYIFLFSVFFVQAQNSSVERDNNLLTDSVSEQPVWIIKSMLQDEGKLWTSPFRMNKRDFIFWTSVAAITSVSIRYDETIYSNVKDFQSKHGWVSDASPVVTYGGENVFVTSAGSLFYLNGLIFKNRKAKQTGLIALQALAHAGIIVRVGKFITGRQRPSVEQGIDKWHWFPNSLKTPMSKYDAFPSGHTIAAWTLAAVVAEQYKDCKIIPPLAYAYATGVGISRITQDAHWFSDVIVGGAMGYCIGKFMARQRSQTKWILLPACSEKNVMLTAVYNF